MATWCWLDDRGVLEVSGTDAVTFLQGLVSNDVTQVTPERALFSAFLTPQGKFLHDFFIAHGGARDGDPRLLLEIDRTRLPDLHRRLRMYKLRSKVALDDVTDAVRVAAVIGSDGAEAAALRAEAGVAKPLGAQPEDGLAFVDPRLADMGARLILPAEGAEGVLAGLAVGPAAPAAYTEHRLALGVPEGTVDLEPEKSTLLESNYDALNAISWDKGCYMGQELTARTRYRGLVKKRLFPVDIDGPLPAPGTDILADGKLVGEMRSGLGPRGLALLRLEAVAAGAPLTAGDATLRPQRPDWLTEAA